MSEMENDIFYDHNPYDYEGTIGFFCQCGLVLHLPINKLTPPITKIKCPVCGFEMAYISRGTKNRNIVQDDLFALLYQVEEDRYINPEEQKRIIEILKKAVEELDKI